MVATRVHLPAHLRHEAATMALYVAIVLLVALAAVGDQSGQDALAIIWGATVGLALAHWFAFTIADRLIEAEGEEADRAQVLAVQMMAAAAIATEVTVAVILLPEKWELDGARLVTAVSIGAIVYALSRSGGRSPLRSAAVGVLAFVLGLAVAAVKLALTH